MRPDKSVAYGELWQVDSHRGRNRMTVIGLTRKASLWRGEPALGPKSDWEVITLSLFMG